MDDPDKFRSHLIGIGFNQYINTIVCDERGLSAPNEQRQCVVLCHGFGTGVGVYYKTIPVLSQHYRVFAIDWLGMGRSSRPPFPTLLKGSVGSDVHFECSIKFFIDSFQTWRREVGLMDVKIVLIGHSLGGYLATHYCKMFQDSIQQLILLSPGTYFVRVCSFLGLYCSRRSKATFA